MNDTVMAFSRFRDRSGLTTRRRVIAYLQREHDRKSKDYVPPEPPIPVPEIFILREDGSYLLREDGSKFIREAA